MSKFISGMVSGLIVCVSVGLFAFTTIGTIGLLVFGCQQIASLF